MNIMHNAITNMAMYKLYDSEGGYIGTFPSWQTANNYRFAYGNQYWKIKSSTSYCLNCWTFKK